MEQDSLQKKAVSSTIIKLTERFLSTGIQLLISIILARLLDPKDYGIIAIINFLIVISNVFLESGLGVGLVQKKELSEIDISTVFVSNLVLGILLYGVIFLIAPFFSDFYKMPILTSVLRVYALSIFFSSISCIQNSLVSRKLNYRFQLISGLISTVSSGALGIFLAYCNFGVWALVWQQVSQRIVYVLIMLSLMRTFPRIRFSSSSFKTIVSFSWKIVITKLVMNIYNQIRNLIIGKQYSAEILGYYNKGHQVPSTIATATDYSLQSVMFSVYSKVQDDIERLKSMVRRSMKVSAFFLFPMMIGLALVAKPLVIIVLTEKWLPSVPFLQICCLMYMLQPVNSANSQAINAIGRSDISLKLEIIKRIFATILIIICVLLKNVYALAFSAVFVSLFGWLQYMIINRKLLKYTMKEQVLDILPILIATAVMGICVYLISFLKLNIYLQLVTQVLVGLVVYLICAFVMKLDSFMFVLNYIKSFISKTK